MSQSAAPPADADVADCYLEVAMGGSALSRCTPDAIKILEAAADASSRLHSESLAETWVRLGTRLHDLVTSPPEQAPGSPTEHKTPVRCEASVAAHGWEQVLRHSRRCILTGMRLLADSREAPRPGTHAGLAMGRVLMHPCAIAEGKRIGSWGSADGHDLSRYAHATRRYSVAGGGVRGVAAADSDGERARDLVERCKAAIERGRCGEAVRLAHDAACLARDSMLVWYNVQVTPKTI